MNHSDDFSVSNIYQAIDIDSNVYQAETDSGPITVVGKDYQSPLYLIERFVNEIDKKKGQPGFEPIPGRRGGFTLKDLPLARYFRLMPSLINAYSDKKIYSLKVALFMEKARQPGVIDDLCFTSPCRRLPGGKFEFDVFNEFIKAIYSELQTERFKRRLRAREYSYAKNLQSAIKYIDALFSTYSRMLVLRIDLGYRKASIYDDHEIAIDEAQADLARLLNNRRGNELFSTLRGYIWKLEFGREKGYHFHVFFFLDGSKSCKDEFLATEIGKYWQKVTDGRGIFYNCNASKQKYRRCGIGMISHSDEEMRENLILALKYLFKKDQFLREKFSEKTRTYGRGEMPKIQGSKAGRPRMKNEGDEDAAYAEID